mmetsp:Transcript_5913/g.8686  ORF Transcript_5913/g.8686 Transcript_5913/m.8686 type:complete len:342 (+) Transcript_5913:118-1143(+)
MILKEEDTNKSILCCSRRNSKVMDDTKKAGTQEENDDDARTVDDTLHQPTPTFRYDVDKDINNLPDVNKWPNRPIYVQAGEGTGTTQCASRDKGQDSDDALPIGTPIEFETNLFKGKILFRVKGVRTSTAVAEDLDKYFKGRRRVKQVVVQGRFKESFPISDVHYGDVYGKPLNISPIVKIASPIFQQLVPGVIMDLSSETPKVVAPMAGEAKTFSVDKPGSEPDICSITLVENTLLLGEFDSINHRKRILRTSQTASQYRYDPSLCFTWEFYDDIIDVAAYAANLPILRMPYSLAYFLNKQPFTFSAIAKGEREIFKFRIYHEIILDDKVKAPEGNEIKN